METTREVTEQQALQRLAALCSRGEHCTGELRDKLRRWQLDDEAQQRILQYLTDHRYVDDERYCRLFIRDKMQFNKWGRRKIEQALWAKHVDEAVSRPLLDEVSTDEWCALLQPLLKGKRRGLKAASDYEADMKLLKFAVSRGFTMDVIRACLHSDTLDCDDDEAY